MSARMKAWLIKQLARWMTPRLRFIYHNPELWRYAESRGWHVTPAHFYQPIPDTSKLRRRARSQTIGVDWNETGQLELLRDIFPKYAAEHAAFYATLRGQHGFDESRLEFVGYDPYVYHCMIRHWRPRRILEVGAGFSTLVALNAARANGRGRVVAIEPFPGDALRAVQDELEILQQGAQETDMARFTSLEAGDILFIDSSHVAKAGSDVLFLVLEVLPRLRPGVIAHFHDIFLPWDYPLEWLTQRRLFWNEQYLLHAYLLHNQRARVLFASKYMAERHADLTRAAFPECERRGGGSLWLRL